MTPLEALKRITDFTEKKIATCLLMRKEPKLTGDVMDTSEDLPEFVNPYVCYGTIPHKNFQPFDFQVPMIMWTFDEVNDDGETPKNRIVNFRCYVGAYSSEVYSNDKLPDHKAFEDLVNALERIYIALSKCRVINGVGIHKPIAYGIYDGAFYPYAYGWVTVTAEIPRMEYEEDEINKYFL